MKSNNTSLKLGLIVSTKWHDVGWSTLRIFVLLYHWICANFCVLCTLAPSRPLTVFILYMNILLLLNMFYFNNETACFDRDNRLSSTL